MLFNCNTQNNPLPEQISVADSEQNTLPYETFISFPLLLENNFS